MQTRTLAKAAIGYGAYRAAKPLARRAAKTRTKRLWQATRRGAPFAAVFAAIAAITGALFVRRRRRA